MVVLERTSTGSTVEDPRFQPTYSYTEASRALNIPPSTLRYWTQGQRYETQSGQSVAEPIILLPEPNESELSFVNMIEAHVLRALRTSHEVSLQATRNALKVAQDTFNIERLLIHSQLRTSAGDLFLREYEKLVELNNSQQLVLDEMFEGYLRRIEYDKSDLPVSFYPLTRGPKEINAPKHIVLDPSISFGRPVIQRKGISTRAVESRIAAGESIRHVSKDYELTEKEVREALLYEVAA